ncbi:MAG TPA: DUF370 domain-containing protein [Bacillota bacterium]|jgi:uncharacterized protein|nr:DUF370 domain-containing protein [Bacillota bacterium]HOB87236.1 DUF370 domain-containing protein [Bacillota bacterium]HOP68259.1 DUF370 domain-containing protein [Bacillota bacterium]HPT33129.1 DUF370 domain-containing protein [Bacillota bacterium]HPZ64198.1 DUF370 domain-containing protein [Bacillota bacterium]
MFLHTGGSNIIYFWDIVGIFDLNLREEPINKQFLESRVENGFLKANDFKQHKSFVVTKDKVYLSPIAPATLAKRNKPSRFP